VAQATALLQAGFNVSENVEYIIDDYFTTIQAALANPDQNQALTSAYVVQTNGNELANQMDFAAFDNNLLLYINGHEGNDVINAGKGHDIIEGGLGADVIN